MRIMDYVSRQNIHLVRPLLNWGFVSRLGAGKGGTGSMVQAGSGPVVLRNVQESPEHAPRHLDSDRRVAHP